MGQAQKLKFLHGSKEKAVHLNFTQFLVGLIIQMPPFVFSGITARFFRVGRATNLAVLLKLKASI